MFCYGVIETVNFSVRVYVLLRVHASYQLCSVCGVRVYVYVHEDVYICMWCACIYVCTCMYVHVWICVCMYVYV